MADDSTLVEALRTSRELHELREEAVVSERLEHVDTTRGEPTVITLVYEEELIPDFMDQQDPAFVGWRRITVRGWFSEDELTKVALKHEELAGPLAGSGVEYVHEDGEIRMDMLWIS